MKVRKIFSVLIAFAMFFSLASVNVFANTINDTDEPDFQHVECNYVEELPDGGKNLHVSNQWREAKIPSSS